MSVITNKWNDGSGDSINIESPSFQGNQTVKISSPVQKGTSKRSMQFIGKCKKDFSKQVILTVEQEASVYTYDLILSSDNTEIAAKGGTANITAVLKTYRNGNLVSTDNVTPVLSGSATGFSISGVTVTASNRTTIVGTERSINVTGKFSNTFDGQTVSANIVIKQEANSQTLREISNRYTSSNPLTGQNTVKANGGTVWVYTFAIYDYTSGDSSKTNVSDECTFGNVTFGTWDSAKHTWTCPSAGTTIYSNNRGASIKVTWGSKKTTYYLYQEKNLESVKSVSGGIYTYGNIVAGTISNKTIPASGGSATATAGMVVKLGINLLQLLLTNIHLVLQKMLLLKLLQVELLMLFRMYLPLLLLLLRRVQLFQLKLLLKVKMLLGRLMVNLQVEQYIFIKRLTKLNLIITVVGILLFRQILQLLLHQVELLLLLQVVLVLKLLFIHQVQLEQQQLKVQLLH